MSVINGTVAFANLTEHEVFNGQSTGKYSVVVSLDDAEAQKLEAEGVKIKTYKDQPQRKFTTKFEDFTVIDNEGEPVSKGSVRWGDKVRIKYNLGNPHPVHGCTPYMQAIRVVEKGEMDSEDDGEF
jgi:hypothetical protein